MSSIQNNNYKYNSYNKIKSNHNNKFVKTIIYFKKVLAAALDNQDNKNNNINNKLQELINKFPAYYNELIDIYILILEKYNNKRQINNQLYAYEDYNYQYYILNNNKKSQQDIINKIILNLDNINQYTNKL